MATVNVEEAEDLLTCSVCLNTFNEGIRKPKFLTCFHTFCVECIKSIISRIGSYFSCPLCRKPTYVTLHTGADGLSNNPYVIQMIKSSVTTDGNCRQKKQRPWCLMCNKAANTGFCSLSTTHTIIYLGTATPESVTKLVEQKRSAEAQIATIVETRKDAKSYFGRLLSAQTKIEDNIKALEEENDLHLAALMSLLESAKIGRNETFESISKRMTDIAEHVKKQAQDAQTMESLYQKRKNTKMSVQFKDEHGKFMPTTPELEQGFTRMELQDRQNPLQGLFELATHIVLYTVNSSSEKFTPQPKPPPPPPPVVTPIPPRVNNSFDASRWVLKMDFKQGYFNYLGEVVIKPYRNFDNFIMMGLIQSCRRPVTFSATILKAHPNTFTTLDIDVSDATLQPLISDPNRFYAEASDTNVDDRLDVGLPTFKFFICKDGVQFMSSFQLTILLKSIRGTNLKRSPKFGRIIEGEDVIANLSRCRLNDRDGYTVTIEAGKA